MPVRLKVLGASEGHLLDAHPDGMCTRFGAYHPQSQYSSVGFLWLEDWIHHFKSDFRRFKSKLLADQHVMEETRCEVDSV